MFPLTRVSNFSFLLLSIVSVIVLYYYFYKNKYGIWINGDDNLIDMDDSMVWKVKFLNFGLVSGFKPITIPQKSKVISYFKGISMLDIYDKKLNHIHHYYKPNVIIQEEGKDLFTGVGYYFMIRYNSSLEDNIETNTFIYTDDKPISLKPMYELGIKDYYNETNLIDESKIMVKKIISEMEQNGYKLDQTIISDTRRSFPSNLLINQLILELEPNFKVVILTTNKRKIFNLNDHSIEFDSIEKQFVWNPFGDNNFCSLFLNGDQGDDLIDITVSEFLYCEKSRILPIMALLFI